MGLQSQTLTEGGGETGDIAPISKSFQEGMTKKGKGRELDGGKSLFKSKKKKGKR